jgi:hypothetical protein
MTHLVVFINVNCLFDYFNIFFVTDSFPNRSLDTSGSRTKGDRDEKNAKDYGERRFLSPDLKYRYFGAVPKFGSNRTKNYIT